MLLHTLLSDWKNGGKKHTNTRTVEIVPLSSVSYIIFFVLHVILQSYFCLVNEQHSRLTAFAFRGVLAKEIGGKNSFKLIDN